MVGIQVLVGRTTFNNSSRNLCKDHNSFGAGVHTGQG